MGSRILIVDDAMLMRAMLRDILVEKSFEIVGEAANGVEAVEMFHELKPDLVTMDIVMPLKSGIEAAREIRKLDERAKIVMCSALGQENLVTEALEAGAADFLVKPFQAEEVVKVVNKVLAA